MSPKDALQAIHDHPNCRHEVEAQLGQEVWQALAQPAEPESWEVDEAQLQRLHERGAVAWAQPAACTGFHPHPADPNHCETCTRPQAEHAEPAAEPVAWRYRRGKAGPWTLVKTCPEWYDRALWEYEPLYPEAAGRAAPAPVSEAVLALELASKMEGADSVWKERFKNAAAGLRRAAPAPEPLTDEQIDAVPFGNYISRTPEFNAQLRAFARAIAALTSTGEKP